MNDFDLLDTACDNVILISDDYCLDKSFDILSQNFNFFVEKFNELDDQSDRIKTLKERFEKNKEKYLKFLNFTNQTSSSLVDVNATFNAYRNIWQTKDTPLEIIYENLISIQNWGTFDQKTGKITRVNSNNLEKTKKQIINWANKNFIEEIYGLYNKIKIRIYLTSTITDTFTFNATFNEKCFASGGQGTVCCGPCTFTNDNKACNRLGPNGRTCGNMYDYCPPATHALNVCVTGSCKGWSSDKSSKGFKFQELKISKSLSRADTYLIGHDFLLLELKNSMWDESN